MTKIPKSLDNAEGTDNLGIAAINNRKNNYKSQKPILEKRRRDRINGSLDELKNLLLAIKQRDPLRYARLEKADILEMVVKYLKDLKKRRQAMIAAMEPHLFRSFKMGYLDCTRATIDFINEIESPTERKKKIIDHITQECMTTLKNQYPSTTFTQHHEVIFANVTPPDHFMPYPLLSSFDSSNDMEWLSLEERLGFSPIGRSNFVSHEPKSPTDCLSSIKAEPLLKCSDQQQGQSLVLKDVSLTLEQSVRLEDERHNSSQISDTDSSDNDEEDSDRKLIIDDHNNNHAWRPWL